MLTGNEIQYTYYIIRCDRQFIIFVHLPYRIMSRTHLPYHKYSQPCAIIKLAVVALPADYTERL